MPITPNPPYPKSTGQTIRAADWNQAVDEVIRLDNAKVNRAGDRFTGPLSVDGNVGIGTTNPIRSLHVNGELSITRSDKFAYINVSDPSGNGGGSIVLRGLDSKGSVQTDATISLIGNVGIGTTAPLAKLQVVTANDTNPGLIFAWDARHFVVGNSAI